MIHLNAVLSQDFTPAELAGAVRTALGKPLRRAAGLAQLAVVGALGCLPPERRELPTALLWQTRSGPRPETLALLAEICDGQGEPMPYDFLATQPAIAAAQLKPFLPGLQSATCLPLADTETAHWSLLLSLTHQWLSDGRYAQVLCAQLDHDGERATGRWLALGTTPLESSSARLHLTNKAPAADCKVELDAADFPANLANWLAIPDSRPLRLQSAASPALTVEFVQF